MILSIDPGPVQSAFAVLDEYLKPIEFGILPNDELLDRLHWGEFEGKNDYFAIEMVAHYGKGMPAGKDVFDTCVWIGRFWQEADCPYKEFIYRLPDITILCGSMRAKDGNIRQALIDRFAQHDFKNGKGTVKNKDWFYGVSKDVWAAIAVGVTYYDTVIMNKKKVTP